MVTEKLKLTALQSNMKVDPEGYSSELSLLYNQFKSSLDLFQQQAALNFTSLSGIGADSSVANDLGDRVMFLAHVTPFYPKELTRFPTELLHFLESSASNLLSGLRLKVTKSLILLQNRKGFAKKLLSRLQSCNERIEVRMRMLQVIARTVGLHHLILLDFYTYLERYVEPRKEYITTVLAAAVQACHEMVPPDAVMPLFNTILTRLVHDQSPPEYITVGLNVVREICLRMPLLMTGELLQDLVLYRKSHDKAASSASRSLRTLFREICPSMLAKKDRGRPAEVKAKPKAFGEVHVARSIPFAELLEQRDQGSSDEDIDASREDDSVHLVEEDGRGDESDCGGSSDSDHPLDDGSDVNSEDDQVSDGATEIGDEEESEENGDDEHGESSLLNIDNNIISKDQKRKFSDFEGQMNAADKSARASKN